MKLKILEKGIDRFAQLLNTREGEKHLYKYAIVRHFHQNWSLERDDFWKMYNAAISSEVTKRWWKRPGYRPREMMLKFIETEPEYTMYAFRDLFDMSKDIEGRLDRFVFYCDQLLQMYRRAHPYSIENNHYQDSAMISLYLSGRYPGQYTLYPGRRIFNAFLARVEARQTQGRDELNRYWKLTRVIYRYLMDSERVMQAVEKSTRSPGQLLLAHEFTCFLSGYWDQPIP